MAAKFNLIAGAERSHKNLTEQTNNATAALAYIAEYAGTTPTVVAESASHILANLRTTVIKAEPIKIMHVNSVAALLAGLEAIAKTLPTLTDDTKRNNTLRALATAGFDNGMINDATFPIVNIGARQPTLQQKYSGMIQQYNSSPNDKVEMLNALGKLQMMLDRAANAQQSASV